MARCAGQASRPMHEHSAGRCGQLRAIAMGFPVARKQCSSCMAIGGRGSANPQSAKVLHHGPHARTLCTQVPLSRARILLQLCLPGLLSHKDGSAVATGRLSWCVLTLPAQWSPHQTSQGCNWPHRSARQHHHHALREEPRRVRAASMRPCLTSPPFLVPQPAIK